MSEPANDAWKRCSSCRVDIDFGAKYWTCSVSTCNRKKLALYFCSLGCWEAHLPEARHRDAWAEEQRAPTREQAERERTAEAAPRRSAPGGAAPVQRRIVPQGPAAASAPARAAEEDDLPRDVLVVVSKLKKDVKARSEMNTSDNVVDVVSDHLRRLCTEAIRNAARDGRKTVMDRDFRPLVAGWKPPPQTD